MKSSSTRRKKKRRFGKIISIILLIIVLILIGMVSYINIIPTMYLILILILTLVILSGTIFCNLSKKKILRLIGYTISIILITIAIFLGTYLYNTLGFLLNITSGNYTLKTYNVLVLKDSNYSKLKDLNNKNIGISSTNDEETISSFQDKINKKINVKYSKYIDSDELINNILKREIDAIILENSEIELMKEDNLESYNALKIIYSEEIKNNVEEIKNDIDINKEPFNIYISGIDTFGKINASSRSDVNIVVSVNPQTEKILITWIPRDYYVFINNSEYKDKLTHAGIYGIDSSIYAIEHLLNIDINYYVKVNFSSVIKIVDVLKGITVYNDETFTTNENITFPKGNVTLNGEKALSFVRDRKHVTGGDLGRGKNQIKVLEALINKALSKDIIKNYNKLLNTLEGSFVTNMSQGTITSFVKKELLSHRDWQIENQILNGLDAYKYTYTYRNKELYVMLPDDNIVKEAKAKINNLINN